MALADPDLPPGIALPELRVDPQPGLDPDRYRWLSVAYYDLPRRSRVVVVLRLPLPLLGRRPLTLRSAGELFGLGPERVRQLAEHAVWMLLRAWLQTSPGDLTSAERHALLAPILNAAIDRHPLDVAEPPALPLDERARQDRRHSRERDQPLGARATRPAAVDDR